MDELTDLGVMPEQTKEPCSPCSSPNPTKEIEYPKLRACDKARDKVVEALGGEVSIGEEVECRVRLKVCGFSDESYGKSIELKVLAMGGVEEVEESEEEEVEEVVEEKGSHKNPAVRKMKAKVGKY